MGSTTSRQGRPVMIPAQEDPGANPFQIPVTVRVGFSPPWMQQPTQQQPQQPNQGQEEPPPKTCLGTWKGFLCTFLSAIQFINGIIASASTTSDCIIGGVTLTLTAVIVFCLELPLWIPAVSCSLHQSTFMENRLWIKTSMYAIFPIVPVIFITCGGGSYIIAFICSVFTVVIYTVVCINQQKVPKRQEGDAVYA